MSKGICSVEDCVKLTRTGAEGWCEAHYYRAHRYGSPDIRHRTNGQLTNGADGIQCPHCHKRLVDQNQIRKHMRAFHADKLEMACDWCGAKFTTAKGLALHMGRKHPVEFAARDLSPLWRKKNLMQNYGLTVEQYDAMAAAQGGECAICGRPEREVRHGRLHVDHDHQTGKIRGLLCADCNLMLGKMKDSPELLRRAAMYLETA